MHIKKPFTNNDVEIVNEQKTIQNIKAWLLTAEDRCTTEETWQCLQELKDILDGNLKDYYLPGISDKKENSLKDIIKNGLETGIVKIENNFKASFGCLEIYCQIGEYSFYFEEDFDKRLMSKKEYLDTYSLDEIAASISQVLETKEIAEQYGIYEDEYQYYLSILGIYEKEQDDYQLE